jgi:hypothetical protein
LFCIGSSVNKVWDILWTRYNPKFQNTCMLLHFFYVIFFAYFIKLCFLFFGFGFLPYCKSLLHIVPFCKGPNKKSEGFAKEKQKTWRVCEGKKICQICDAEHIATCGAPLIANLEWTFNHRRTFTRYTTNKTLRSAQSLSTVAIFHLL